MSDRICCFNVITAAGIVTSFQMVIMVMALSSTGLVLDRYRFWRQEEVDLSVSSNSNGTVKTSPTIWSVAWVELAMAWYVGFGAFWLFSLLAACLSFKYSRPLFVVPNFVALVVGIFMNAFGFAVILGRILDVSKGYRTKQYDEAILVYVMAFLLFVFLINFVFLFCMARYHQYLSARYEAQNPKSKRSRHYPQHETDNQYPAEDY